MIKSVLTKPNKCSICRCKIGNETINDKDFVAISKYWGYTSNKDGEYHEIIICFDCYDKIIEYIETIGGKIKRYQYALLSGDILKEIKNK